MRGEVDAGMRGEANAGMRGKADAGMIAPVPQHAWPKPPSGSTRGHLGAAAAPLIVGRDGQIVQAQLANLAGERVAAPAEQQGCIAAAAAGVR